MPTAHLASLLRILEEVFASTLTRPSFCNLLVLVVGWVLTQEPLHTVTGALVATGLAGRRHHEAFHRFFSRGSWNPDEIGYFLLRRIERWVGPGPLRVVVDDTLTPKKGPHIFGLGTHLDAVRSTRLYRVLSFGHVWVVLAVLIQVPFSDRLFALPLLFRLYRNEKDCERRGLPHRKKTELAREMIDTLCRWAYDRRIELAADQAYCNDTITHGLPERVVLFGAMRADAVLTAAPNACREPAKAGRPAKRGAVLPKPEQVAHDESWPWQRCTATLYGRSQSVSYKTFFAQWYRACGTRLLRVVVVATTTGHVPFRVFFCTDTTLDVATVLETYAGRWPIEVCFRDLKQLLGLSDSPARLQSAVLRMVPFVGLLSSVLVLWFADQAWCSPIASPPVRPWYRHKNTLCFADILRAARRMLSDVDISDPARLFNNLHKPASDPMHRDDPPLPNAA
jgi:DDE superfamily endonuclease